MAGSARVGHTYGWCVDLVERTEARRAAATARLDPAGQKRLGQFFTPAPAAGLIASLVDLGGMSGTVRVLDPGAGAGSLTAAVVARIRTERPDLTVHVVAVETDPVLLPVLAETLADCDQEPGVSTELVDADFVTASTGLDPDPRLLGPFDLVVMNPPYGKLSSGSPHRRAVAATVVDVPNLYAAFWALGVAAARTQGQVAAIVPRSWANGTYFTAFRHWLLDVLRLDVLHVFESRSAVFADTGVLQENVIVTGTVGGPRRAAVTLSASVGHTDDVVTALVPTRSVVQPADPHRFVRFTDGAASVPPAARFSLDDLGLKVSTGKVIDFRNRELLATEKEPGTVPLVWPGHVRGGLVVHPREIRKPQWLRVDDVAAARLLLPPGAYVVVRRFSAKEERRRVVAAVWDRPEVSPGLENHLNYLHAHGRPLPPGLAHGLSAWLNSTALDALFRTFSGHTQVNAGDLRTLPFPGREDLEALGRAVPGGLPEQDELDRVVDEVLAGVVVVAS